MSEEETRKPHGCSDLEHFKECQRNGYLIKGCYCHHPDNNYVNKLTGNWICKHSELAVHYKTFNQRKDEESV